MTDLSVIVVCHNSGPYLRECLDSLALGVGDLSWELVLVDNGSTDGAPDRLGSTRETGRPERVLRLSSPLNLGYAAAANLGAAVARGRHLVFLNPDTRCLNDTLARLARQLDSDPGLGAAGPALEDEQGCAQASARAFPGYSTVLFHRRAPLSRWWPANPGSTAYLFPARPDWLSGAVLAVRREAWEDVGGFDPRYFLYVEDVDFCARLHAAGRQVAYVPEARVLHRVDGERRPPARRRVLEHHRGMWRYYQKHLARGPVRGVLTWLGILGRCAWHSTRVST